MKAEEYVARHSALQKERDTLDWHLQEVSDITFPRRSLFTFKDRTKGDRRNLLQYDTTAEYANTLLASGLHGMLTNPASKWFYLSTANEELRKDRPTQEWLNKVTDIIYSHINSPKAGFSNNMHECYLEYGAFGTTTMFIGENDKLDGIMFNCRSLVEVLIAENSDGFVDTVYRKFKMTVRQIAQKWGTKALTKGARKSFDKKEYEAEVSILHAVQPRGEVDSSKGNKGLPFASVYLDLDEGEIINESGFHEMPYMVARFYKAPNETYGRCPGTQTLPDNKMLQEMMKTTIKAAQLAASPPLQAPDDGFLGPIRTLPNSINYYRSGESDRIEPINTGSNVGISIDFMNEIRERILKAFFIDQLQLGVGPAMTATEVLQRTEERLRLLGPVLGRLQSEFLGPMIDRIFGILLRAKKFPAPPESSAGADLKVEYESPIAKSQQQLEANGLLRMLEVTLPIIDRNPSLIDNFDGDFVLRNVGRMFTVDTKTFKPIEEVEANRAAEAEAQKKADETQLMKDGALGMNQGAQAVSTLKGD